MEFIAYRPASATPDRLCFMDTFNAIYDLTGSKPGNPIAALAQSFPPRHESSVLQTFMRTDRHTVDEQYMTFMLLEHLFEEAVDLGIADESLFEQGTRIVTYDARNFYVLSAEGYGHHSRSGYEVEKLVPALWCEGTNLRWYQVPRDNILKNGIRPWAGGVIATVLPPIEETSDRSNLRLNPWAYHPQYREGQQEMHLLKALIAPIAAFDLFNAGNWSYHASLFMHEIAHLKEYVKQGWQPGMAPYDPSRFPTVSQADRFYQVLSQSDIHPAYLEAIRQVQEGHIINSHTQEALGLRELFPHIVELHCSRPESALSLSVDAGVRSALEHNVRALPSDPSKADLEQFITHISQSSHQWALFVAYLLERSIPNFRDRMEFVLECRRYAS